MQLFYINILPIKKKIIILFSIQNSVIIFFLIGKMYVILHVICTQVKV